ncbi:MAG: hypothetical protein AAGH92_10255 [Planctomycetota bacterium]
MKLALATIAFAAIALSSNITAQDFDASGDFTPRPTSREFEQATPESVREAAPIDRGSLEAGSNPDPQAARDPNRLMPVRLTDVGQEAIRGGEVPWSVLVAAAGLLITITVGISLHRRLSGQRTEPTPGETFVTHARSVGLSWMQILLLVRIARSAKLPTPLTLLVASGPLYHHGRQFAAGFSMARRDRIHRAISAIHRKAFPHTMRTPQITPPTPAPPPNLAPEAG